MSAFIVSKRHIDALVTAALESRRLSEFAFDGYTRVIDDPSAFGQMLCNENQRSVNYRYRETNEADEYHFARYEGTPILTDGVIAKLADCFDYQACETDDYEQTPTVRFINYLRDTLIARLPGYEDAPWGLPDLPTSKKAACQ